MSRFILVVGAFAFVMMIGLLSYATAEPPQSSAEQKIRAALEGQPLDRATGDGVLDDVIGIIQKQGSILDGSPLDPKSDAVVDGKGNSGVSGKALVAEQLLKSARLLEGISQSRSGGSQSVERTALVTRMRAEAGKLLSE